MLWLVSHARWPYAYTPLCAAVVSWQGDGQTAGALSGIGSGFWKAFVNSVLMILATEIGDKT